jgi:hypothetical protein
VSIADEARLVLDGIGEQRGIVVNEGVREPGPPKKKRPCFAFRQFHRVDTDSGRTLIILMERGTLTGELSPLCSNNDQETSKENQAWLCNILLPQLPMPFQ